MYHHSRSCPPLSRIPTCCRTPHRGRTMHQSGPAELSNSSERMTNLALHSQRMLDQASLYATRDHQGKRGLAEYWQKTTFRQDGQSHVMMSRTSEYIKVVRAITSKSCQGKSRCRHRCSSFSNNQPNGSIHELDQTCHVTTHRPRSLIKTF